MSVVVSWLSRANWWRTLALYLVSGLVLCVIGAGGALVQYVTGQSRTITVITLCVGVVVALIIWRKFEQAILRPIPASRTVYELAYPTNGVAHTAAEFTPFAFSASPGFAQFAVAASVQLFIVTLPGVTRPVPTTVDRYPVMRPQANAPTP